MIQNKAAIGRNPPAGGMKIAFVVEHCHLRGGHERCVAEWARRLAKRHQVTVVSHSLADIAPGLIKWEKIGILPGPAPITYLGFYCMAGVRIRSLSDHIVHSQGPNCPGFDVSSIHTVVKAKWAILKASQELRSELSARQYASWSSHYWLASRIEEKLYRNPRGVLAPVSHGTATEVIELYGTPPASIEVVPNGVDLDVFKLGGPEEREQTLIRLGLDPKFSYALFVGGEWTRKGLPQALEILAQCDGRIHLVVAGRGPVSFYGELAKKFGVNQRVHFTGPVADTSSLYRTGLALLMPSLYEAFSLVSLEAAASGLPILASPVSGTEELIVKGENGWVMPPEAGIWAEHLNALAADSYLAERMGVKSREVASQFTWDRAVEQFEEIYGRI